MTEEERFPWLGPQVMLGLMYERLTAGQRLLDIGIGAGASSAPFARAGLEICGVDSSKEQLRKCEEGPLDADLTRHDIFDAPWPYDDHSFHHAVSLGVLNHFGDLGPVFTEVHRVLRVGGLFGFTVEPLGAEGRQPFLVKSSHGHGHHYQHRVEHIRASLGDTGLDLELALPFLSDRRSGQDTFFIACLAQKG